MVQSEVADRLAATPGSKSYGSPSVKASWWADVSLAGSVGRSIFWPVPNVDSSLVKFVRHSSPGDEALRILTFRLIDAAFAQRRKMLRGAIADAVGGSAVAIEIIESAGIAADCRGETLVLKEYVALARAFAARGQA